MAFLTGRTAPTATAVEKLPPHDGLDDKEALLASSRIMDRTIERSGAEDLRALDAEYLAAAQSGAIPAQDHDGATRLMKQLMMSGLVLFPEVLPPEAERRFAPDRWAIKHALAALAAADPRVLAAALDVGASTVYSYSDMSQAHRPGPVRLYRAAFFFRFLSQLFDHVADNLTKVAQTVAPAKRGRPRKPVDDTTTPTMQRTEATGHRN